MIERWICEVFHRKADAKVTTQHASAFSSSIDPTQQEH
jgi:hypothetical protein